MRLPAVVLASMLVASIATPQELAPDRFRESRRHYRAGLELMSAERWEQAAHEFQSAVAIDRLLAMGYYNLGRCRMNQRRYAEAVVALKTCRTTFEQLGSMSQTEREERDRVRRDEIYELKDSLRRVEQGQLRSDALVVARMQDRVRQLEAMQFRDRAGDWTVPGEVSLALGSAYFRQGRLQDAEREYRESLKVDRRLGAAHNNLAVLYLMTGRPEAAHASTKLAEQNGFRVSAAFKADLKAALQKAESPSAR